MEILKAAIAVEGQGSLEEITGKPGFYRLKPPPRWEGLARQTLTVGPRTDRMELVFDTALVEEEVGGRRVLRLKKHQILLRLGHPIMRQAMATLCRQLHDPTAHDPIYRWSLAALHRTGFDALLVFYYTITAINELREPLHDEVACRVFRIVGDTLEPVDHDFEQSVLGSEFHPVKSPSSRDDWVKAFRGRWLTHRRQLEAFLRSQESALKTRPASQGGCHEEAGDRGGEGELPLPAQGVAGPQPRPGTGEARQGDLQGRSRDGTLRPSARGRPGDPGRARGNWTSRWKCSGRTWSGPVNC